MYNKQKLYVQYNKQIVCNVEQANCMFCTTNTYYMYSKTNKYYVINNKQTVCTVQQAQTVCTVKQQSVCNVQ